MPRYLIVVDPDATNVETAAKALIKAKIKVDDKMEFLNTLVVNCSKEKALALPKKMKGILSIEEEGEVGALD